MTLSVYRTAPQAEFKAEKELQDEGHNGMCPSIRVRIRQGKRVIWRRVPLARGYVMADTKADEKRYAMKHVRSRVGAVDPQQVVRMMAIAATEKAMEAQRDVAPTFSPGDKCRVSSGPLEGFSVEVRSFNPKKPHLIYQITALPEDKEGSKASLFSVGMTGAIAILQLEKIA